MQSASTKDRPPSIPQHRNRNEVDHVDTNDPEAVVSNARLRGCNVRDHDGVGIAFTCISAGLSRQTHSYHRAVCGRRHHRRHRPRAGTAARGGLGSTGRDREQAWRRHWSGRHRIRRAIRTRRLHAPGDRRRDLRHRASYLQQAAVRPHQRLCTGHRPRGQPAGAGRSPSLPVRTLGELGDYARRDRASAIMEPSALDRADISTSFCWKA